MQEDLHLYGNGLNYFTTFFKQARHILFISGIFATYTDQYRLYDYAMAFVYHNLTHRA